MVIRLRMEGCSKSAGNCLALLNVEKVEDGRMQCEHGCLDLVSKFKSRRGYVCNVAKCAQECMFSREGVNG